MFVIIQDVSAGVAELAVYRRVPPVEDETKTIKMQRWKQCEKKASKLFPIPQGVTRERMQYKKLIFAGVAELADALDLGSSIFRCAGSSPVTRTISSVHNVYEVMNTRFL